jgi:hypothetical protein
MTSHDLFSSVQENRPGPDSHNHSQPSAHTYMQLIQYNLKPVHINDDDNDEEDTVLIF